MAFDLGLGLHLPKKPHPLDQVTPRQVLNRCFQTFGCFCRFLGILPIQILPDGSATFSLLSMQFIHTLVYTILFISMAAYFLPLYIRQKSFLKSSNLENYLSEYVFSIGQYLGVVVTILLIPLMASRVAGFWNGLLPLVQFIVENGQGFVYKRPYIRSRISLVVHSIMWFIYAIICWRDFEFAQKADEINWLKAAGLVAFYMVCFCHLLPFMVFKFFVIMLHQSFKGLRAHVTAHFLADANATQLQEKPSMERMREVMAIFDGLTTLCHKLGRAFGLYLVVEMVVLMTSVLMNVFTMLSGFQQRDPWSTLGCFGGYVGILIVMTEGGQSLKLLGRDCLKTIRVAAYSLPNVDPIFLHRIGCARSPTLTADNYFVINRQLAITMASTFATYIVVMIQFKLNSKQIADNNLVV